MSEQVALELKTGEGKRTWYGYVVSVGDYTGDLVFIDKIHYLYLKSLQSGDDSLQSRMKHDIRSSNCRGTRTNRAEPCRADFRLYSLVMDSSVGRQNVWQGVVAYVV